eukprot:7385524-Prymnesium_polylepis.1
MGTVDKAVQLAPGHPSPSRQSPSCREWAPLPTNLPREGPYGWPGQASPLQGSSAGSRAVRPWTSLRQRLRRGILASPCAKHLLSG